MQTGKFTIFDYEQLQDLEKQSDYQNIIQEVLKKRELCEKKGLNDYRTRSHEMMAPKTSSFYITVANRIVQRKNLNFIHLRTVNEKMLVMTTFVFPDNQKFLNILEQYGINKEECLNFSEKIKSLGFYEESKRKALLELMIQEYFETLNQVKMYYGTNNTGIIINKILEIAYLHPELLHTKEKS